MPCCPLVFRDTSASPALALCPLGQCQVEHPAASGLCWLLLGCDGGGTRAHVAGGAGPGQSTESKSRVSSCLGGGSGWSGPLAVGVSTACLQVGPLDATMQRHKLAITPG